MPKLENIKRVFFLGIGGIGMSAVARYFVHLGKTVYGYDRTKTDLTLGLEQEGMKIHYLDDVECIPSEIDLVVWTPAIPKSNEQFMRFVDSDLQMMKRAEVLGLISKEKRVIAVAGTHGKTTTSIMLSYLLKSANVDLSAFLGGISTDFESNFLAGNGEWAVMEADEFDRSFWHLYPEIVILTSMDADHLDVYGDHDEMIRSYKVFIEQLNEGGILIYQHSLIRHFDKAFLNRLKERNIQLISYGMESGDARSTYSGVKDGLVYFDYEKDGEKFIDLPLMMPGVHNVENMTGAITAAIQVSEGIEIAAEIKGFSGIERRFEFMKLINGWQVVTDYAHHPEELEAAVAAARSFFGGRHLTGVFQPHLYTRTKDHAAGFARALDKLDQPVLVELYPAREEPIENISSETILNKMEHEDVLLTTKKELIDELENKNIDVLLILGAGDLDAIVRKLKIN